MDTFEDFARSRADGLVRLGLVLSGSQQDAEDLAQETLLKAHQSWAKVQSADSPDAYVRRIALNLYLSGRRRWRPRFIGLDAASDVASPEPASEDEQGLRRLVAGLPLRQRTALVLRFYLGLSTAEIAEDMQLSPASVRSAVARAQETLRTQLAVQTKRGQW